MSLSPALADFVCNDTVTCVEDILKVAEGERSVGSST